MVKVKIAHFYSYKRTAVMFFLVLASLAAYSYYSYFNNSTGNDLGWSMGSVWSGLAILEIYRYFTLKSLHIRGISQYDFDNAFEHALTVNNIETVRLNDGFPGIKKLQVKNSNIKLNISLSWPNSYAIIFKKTKDEVLYDKISASMKDYLILNNIARQTKNKKLAIVILPIIALIIAVGYFSSISG